jgi:hypothetical protein
VEPVPRPTIMLSSTRLAACSATSCLSFMMLLLFA